MRQEGLRMNAEHREMVEFYSKHNAILEIEIRDDDSFCIKQIRKYNMQQQQQQQQPDENNNNT